MNALDIIVDDVVRQFVRTFSFDSVQRILSRLEHMFVGQVKAFG